MRNQHLGRLHLALDPMEASMYLLGFIMQLHVGIMAPVLPEVKRAFEVSATELALVVSAFGFARLILDSPMGFERRFLT